MLIIVLPACCCTEGSGPVRLLKMLYSQCRSALVIREDGIHVVQMHIEHWSSLTMLENTPHPVLVIVRMLIVRINERQQEGREDNERLLILLGSQPDLGPKTGLL
jgi:hypothetical protein